MSYNRTLDIYDSYLKYRITLKRLIHTAKGKQDKFSQKRFIKL